MKRMCPCVLVTVVLGLVLSGCSRPRPADTPGLPPSAADRPAPTAGATGELTLWTIWNSEPRKTALEHIVAGFEKANPGVKVTVSNLEPDAYKTKIRVALGGDNPPDIFFVWSGEKMLHNFVRGGNCLDLTPYLDADGGRWRQALVANSLSSFTHDNATWGIPYLLQCTFFFYNKDIFSKAGVAVPKTWSELTEVCGKLKQQNITPIALGNLERWPAHHIPCVLFQRLMGHDTVMAQYDPLGPGDYSDPRWLQALDMFQETVDAGFYTPSPNGVSRADARMMFYTEKAAMFYTGTWDFAQLSENGEAPSSFWNKWDFFNFPAVEDGAGEQEALEGSADGYVVSAKSKHPDEAVAFLKYMTSQPVAAAFVDECKELVQVHGAVTDDNSNWYLRRYAKMVQDADVVSAWTDTMMERSVAETLMNGIQGMIAGEKAPEQVMKEVAARQAEVKKELQATQAAGGKTADDG